VKTFEIDFVRTSPPHWLAPLFLAGAAVVLALSWTYFSERREAARDAATAQRKAIEDAMRPPDLSSDELKRRESAAQERAAIAYRWKNIFDALEAAGGSEVKVVSFSHDRAAGKSHIVLEGPSFGAIDSAVARMKAASPRNAQWLIESVSHEQAAGANVVRANVVGSW
jgi:hypothetical protein